MKLVLYYVFDKNVIKIYLKKNVTEVLIFVAANTFFPAKFGIYR